MNYLHNKNCYTDEVSPVELFQALALSIRFYFCDHQLQRWSVSRTNQASGWLKRDSLTSDFSIPSDHCLFLPKLISTCLIHTNEHVLCMFPCAYVYMFSFTFEKVWTYIQKMYEMYKCSLLNSYEMNTCISTM